MRADRAKIIWCSKQNVFLIDDCTMKKDIDMQFFLLEGYTFQLCDTIESVKIGVYTDWQ